MNLVIVESPSKTKTIKQYLGQDFDVVATKGHIRDIQDTGVDNLGLDIKNGYKPIYAVIPKQKSTINMLNETVKKADKIYLATDPDREGEAISWHLKEVLDFGNREVKRIEFNEITESAINNAIKNPRDIDENLFEAQETRKIIDRIIGYKLSSILKRSVGSDATNKIVSAGRVQSACLKIIIDRENEIKNFVPVTYYQIEANFKNFKAMLIETGKSSAWKTNDEEQALEVLNSLDEFFVVSDIIMGKRSEKSSSPFTTSTLIQAALNKYNMSSKKTMKIAQELYEGVDVNGRHVAFITYMRTDSTRISDDFKNHLRAHIVSTFGKEYLGYVHTYNNNENTQNAHEAIRPVSLFQTPEKAKSFLSPDQLKIYTLIYNQTVESMMRDAEIETKTVILTNYIYNFSVTFEKTVFDGFKKNRSEKEQPSYEFKHSLGDIIKPSGPLKLLKKETEGPKRFTEATIVKEMESSGIGRPSTYSSTIETLKSRQYVSVEKKKLVPTEQGNIVSKFLDVYFGDVINVDYTASMEEELDKIAIGEEKESEIVPSFYNNFIELMNKVSKDVKPVETGEICPECGAKLVYRVYKGSRFIACSNYPKCRYVKRDEVKSDTYIECPECHTGHLVQRVNKAGRRPGSKFWGCSNYPSCKFVITSLSSIKVKK